MARKITVYLVVGETGEYDDYQHWNVRAYRKREDADALSAALNAIARVPGKYRYSWAERSAMYEKLMDAGDPNPSIDYNGTSYEVVELELA